MLRPTSRVTVVIALTMLAALCSGRPTPLPPPEQIDHIVILRFCLTKAGKEFNEAQCAAILTLFETTMLLSLREQNADFRVLAYVGTPMSEHLRARLTASLAPIPHRLVSVSQFFEPGHHDTYLEEAKIHFNDFLEGSTTNQYHTRITTRVDVDDFMHRDTLRDIQALYNYPRVNGVLVVNQLRGYRMTFTNVDGQSALQCHLSPMDYPFLAIGQSLLTDANKNFSILDFIHDRVRFVGALVDTAGINSTDTPSVVGAFKTLPLERGYIYVRHALSNSQNLMDASNGAVSCDDVADDLYHEFGIKRADMRHLASLVQQAHAAH